MSTNGSNDIVTVRDWSARFNIPDNLLVVSCTVSSADASRLITGTGLLVNNAEVQRSPRSTTVCLRVVSMYTGF